MVDAVQAFDAVEIPAERVEVGDRNLLPDIAQWRMVEEKTMAYVGTNSVKECTRRVYQRGQARLMVVSFGDKPAYYWYLDKKNRASAVLDERLAETGKSDLGKLTDVIKPQEDVVQDQRPVGQNDYSQATEDKKGPKFGMEFNVLKF